MYGETRWMFYFCSVTRPLMKKHFNIIVLLLICSFTSCEQTSATSETPYVILISFDGFRHDYVQKYETPNFDAFIANGVAAEAMIPSYPSKTFPNHYSIVTGMYPNNHGLVDNSFYDKELDKRYSIGNREMVENPAFYGGLPLWQLVQKNEMKSASYFWVGSEAPIAGSFPDFYEIYDGKVPNEDRIDTVIDWLNLEKEARPNFVSLYFSLVDDAGHASGPNAERTNTAVQEADRLLGLLMTELKSVDLPVNVIITSDHGMNEIAPKAENYIDMADLLSGLDQDKVLGVSNGAHVQFYLKEASYRSELMNYLESYEKSSLYEVYEKGKMPESWNYGTHPRVGDVFIKMTPGNYISSKNRIERTLETESFRGEHGFNPEDTEDMGAIFYANGPNFKNGATLPKFNNIHVYPLIARILGIQELPAIDGKLEVLEPALRD